MDWLSARSQDGHQAAPRGGASYINRWNRLVRIPLAAFLFGFASGVLLAGKIGDLEWEETLMASLEYNSNINSSENEPIDDWIFEASFGISGQWDLTEAQKLNYGFGIGYRRYIGGGGFEIDNAAIRYLPDTSIDLAIRVADNLNFKISDSLTFTENATGIALQPNDSGEAVIETDIISFERITNHFEIEGTWDWNRYNSLVASIYREDTFPLQSRFDAYRRIAEGINGQWIHKLSSRLDTGLQGGVFRMRHRGELKNDSHGYHWGPFANYRLSENFGVNGYLHFSRSWYEEPEEPVDYDDQDSFDGVQWGVGATHSFNRTMAYELNYSVSTDYSYLANFRRVRTLSLVYTWQAANKLQTFASGSYEWGHDSGGRAPDDWEKLYLAAGFSYPFDRFELSSNVRWTNKNSHVPTRSFDQFIFYISLVYHFGDD
jgi:hypothetical protein